MSRCGLVRPKHRVDSVLPVCGGQAEHGPGRAALQMGCRIIRLPNARTSGPICVSSRRDVVAARLQDRSCRTRSRLTDGEGRWRRLHKPQANAGPEFDGCLEVMDQASVFLLSRLLRRPGGQWCAAFVLVLALSCAADLAGWSAPRLQPGVPMYPSTFVPTLHGPQSSPAPRHCLLLWYKPTFI